MAAEEGPTFEQARAELEQVVRRLEDGNTSLDEALALWERGEELYRLCAAKLDEAEERVAQLSEALQSARPADQDQPVAAPRSRPTGRISRLCASCSSMCAVQPAVRAAANVAVYRSGARSTLPSTAAA